MKIKFKPSDTQKLYTACDIEDRISAQVVELRGQGIRAEPRLVKKGSLWHVELVVNGEVYKP